MKQVKVFDNQGNMILCLPETAAKLLRLGYLAEEPKKGKSRKAPKKSDETKDEV